MGRSIIQNKTTIGKVEMPRNNEDLKARRARFEEVAQIRQWISEVTGREPHLIWVDHRLVGRGITKSEIEGMFDNGWYDYIANPEKPNISELEDTLEPPVLSDGFKAVAAHWGKVSTRGKVGIILGHAIFWSALIGYLRLWRRIPKRLRRNMLLLSFAVGVGRHIVNISAKEIKK